jgi:hypothetical protein
MITTLISIQTICIAVATSQFIKRSRPKKMKMKLVSKEFKHYKTF